MKSYRGLANTPRLYVVDHKIRWYLRLCIIHLNRICTITNNNADEVATTASSPPSVRSDGYLYGTVLSQTYHDDNTPDSFSPKSRIGLPTSITSPIPSRFKNSDQ
ncbi:hypothetical protein FRC18_011714 [Serendipita sp. 400]|nr:hypothetical protein FRC18_011714 [Serendipita sp. 400]